MTTSIVSNTQNTGSTFNLPTNVVDKTVNTFKGLSPANKIIAISAAGIVLVGLVGLITYCCYKSRQRARSRRRMQISYPLTPLSPTLRRRR